MRTFGLLLLICGALALVVGLGIDTTVSGVHNIGLMNEKQNTILLGVAMAIVGHILRRLRESQCLVSSQSGCVIRHH